MFAETREEYTQRRARLGIVPASPVVRIPNIPKPRDVLSVDPEPEPIKPERPPAPDALTSISHIPAWRRIINEVGEKYGFTYKDIISARQDRPLVLARHEAMWRMRYEENMSKPRIGERLGGRDHATVYHGIKRHESRVTGIPYRRKSYVSTANKENNND